MADLRSIIAETEYEVIKIKCNPKPHSVVFTVPDNVKETLPIATVRSIEGHRILRFYLEPAIGHSIEFKGHMWVISGVHHVLQLKGSPNPDRLPTILTEYLGEA